MTAALAHVAQLFNHRLTHLRHIQRGDVLKAQTQHVHAEREGIGTGVALQKAHILQGLHHAVGGGLRHIHQPVQLGKGQFAMLLAKGQQQLQATLQPRHQILHFLIVCHHRPTLVKDKTAVDRDQLPGDKPRQIA